MKFNSHCPISSEEKPFENIDRQLTYDFWSSAQNNLDLQNFIVVKLERIIV